jgi:hypothetical protein
MGRYVFFHPRGREPEWDDFILWRLAEVVREWGFERTLDWVEGLHRRGFLHLLMITTPADLSPEFSDTENQRPISAVQLNTLIHGGATMCIASSASEVVESDEMAEYFLSQLNPPPLGPLVTDPRSAAGIAYPARSQSQQDLDALVRDLRTLGTHST